MTPFFTSSATMGRLTKVSAVTKALKPA